MGSIYFILFLSEFATGLVSPFFTFLFFSSNSTFFPAMVSDAERAMAFGIFLALYKFAGMICNPVFGSLSDILGRKITTVITVLGMFILAVATIIAIILQSMWTFIIGATLFSFLFATKPICTAAINDISFKDDNKIKNQALVQFWIGLGVSIGPIIGGYIGDVTVLGYYYILPFIILLICSSYLYFHSRFLMKETLRKRERSRIGEQFNFDPIKAIFKSKLFVTLLFIHVLNQLSWGTYYDFIPAVAKTVFDYDVKTVGILMGGIGACLILTSGLVIPLFPKKISGSKLIFSSCFTGFIGVSIAYLASFFPSSALANILFWLSALPVAGGDVVLFCYLICRFSESLEKKYQGTVVGFIYITGFGMWSLSAPLGGWLMKWTLNGALLMAPFSMLILLLFLKTIKKKAYFMELDAK